MKQRIFFSRTTFSLFQIKPSLSEWLNQNFQNIFQMRKA